MVLKTTTNILELNLKFLFYFSLIKVYKIKEKCFKINFDESLIRTDTILKGLYFIYNLILYCQKKWLLQKIVLFFFKNNMFASKIFLKLTQIKLIILAIL